MLFVDSNSKMFDSRQLSRCHLVLLLLSVEVTSCVHGAERTGRSDDSGPLEVMVQSQAQEITTLKAQLQATETSLRTMEASLKAQILASETSFTAQLQASESSFTAQLQAAEAKISTLGSTYVRWGRTVCPAGAELVYKGIAGGSKHNEQGGGANRLCMSSTPDFDQASVLEGYHTNIHGTEFYIPGHPGSDAPCAVCRTSHPTTIMIPGTHSCPQDWSAQYSGHIMAGDSRYIASSEYLCVDGQPEDREGTGVDGADGGYFMHSTISCGSMPCPPYIEGKVATCVVCSK